MFGFFKKKFNIVAPVDGKVIELSKVPDEVFAQKLAGDGVGIDSISDIITAPADGKLTLIFNTNHAFAMTLDNGVEILVHIGIDTVELKGEGFERLVETGSRVNSGEPIIKINRQLIKKRGYSLVTLVLIANMDVIDKIDYNLDTQVKSGKNIVFNYKIK
ncbi:PTS glucose transporter subunit IIA [Clostridium aestuarii]|uniref:PTS glucose transporter subunit IIA n=1 Tax=Clostridium aestuarii TaxID=338193 RepID=A0ABT4D530_9CLOT|nr:PTS glucose transporter subunit IIA [Clostridium aestuarii]MCY6485305.1 PTS glucose transporter subunit IIA [Clostridium aestuarii]